MALINCPECDKEISDTIKKCPHCGFKIKKIETEQSIFSNAKNMIVESIPTDKKKRNILFSVIGAIAIIIIVALILIFTGNSQPDEPIVEIPNIGQEVEGNASLESENDRLKSESNSEPASKTEPIKLYEDEKVKISYIRLVDRESDENLLSSWENNTGILFNVENKLDTNITIFPNSLSINKVSLDVTGIEDVAPNSVGEILMRFGKDIDAKMTVDIIGGEFNINNGNEYTKATFSNISINSVKDQSDTSSFVSENKNTSSDTKYSELLSILQEDVLADSETFITAFMIKLYSEDTHYRISSDGKTMSQMENFTFYAIGNTEDKTTYPFYVGVENKNSNEKCSVAILMESGKSSQETFNAFTDVCAFALQTVDESLNHYEALNKVVNSEKEKITLNSENVCVLSIGNTLTYFLIV